MGYKCYPVTDPNRNWNYCPSFGAAVLFSTLFALATITHSIQAIVYKKPFAIVLIMGAAWECAGYIFRTLSVQHQLESGYALAQLLLILLAPLWINAFIYMVLGRALHFFLEDDRVFKFKARKITLMFVLFDISAFIVQAIGGAMTSNAYPVHTQQLGLHIYMGGVGLQLFYISIFITLAARFQQKITSLMDRESFTSTFAGRLASLFSRPKSPSNEIFDPRPDPSQQTRTLLPAYTGENAHKHPQSALRLLYIVYTILTLIIFRNIYRLIEFSQGVLSDITTHEWYAYVFDALPMLLAFVILACFHPGQILRGARCDFSEENSAIKAEKKMKKMNKRQARDDGNRQKLQGKLEKKEAKAAKKAGGETV